MAGRPVQQMDFLGEEEIGVLREKMRNLYDLFVEECDIESWRREADFKKRENMKRNANQSLLMLKPLTVIVENLCKQFSGNDDVLQEMQQMLADIKKHEVTVNGKG